MQQSRLQWATTLESFLFNVPRSSELSAETQLHEGRLETNLSLWDPGPRPTSFDLLDNRNKIVRMWFAQAKLSILWPIRRTRLLGWETMTRCSTISKESVPDGEHSLLRNDSGRPFIVSVLKKQLWLSHTGLYQAYGQLPVVNASANRTGGRNLRHGCSKSIWIASKGSG